MFTFLHAADVHLDSPLIGLSRYEGAPVKEIRSATRQAFENLVSLALERRVSFVILAGDLYDGDWKDFTTGLFFVHQMARLREASVPVFLVSGNHDADSQLTHSLPLPDNVRRFSSSEAETYRLDELDVAVHGRSYPRRQVDEDLTESYPDPMPGMLNIGVLHTSLDGRPEHACYAPCSLDGLRARGYDYWALGHVHAEEVVSEEPWVVFPGNIQGRHARELGPKGCVLVSVDDGEVLGVEKQTLDVMRWACCQIDAPTATTAEHVIGEAAKAFDRLADETDDRLLAVRLEIRGNSAAHRELVARREQLLQDIRALSLDRGGGRLWLEKVIVATQTPPLTTGASAQAAEELGQMIRPLEKLVADEALVADLADAFKALWTKLPAKVQGLVAQSNDDAWPATAAQVLAEAREIVLAALSEERR
jgi:DNA repair exonuclease SbcCD nuclease subunit